MENLGEWMGAVALLILAGDRISKLTATKRDDAFFAWIYKLATVLGVRIIEPKDPT